MKIAIYKDTTVMYEAYSAYRYNWWFRLFGPGCVSIIASHGASIDDLIDTVRRRINGKLEFIEIIDV